MPREYKDLSRRALIRLNEDFDDEYDDMLYKYLGIHEDEYEGIRTIEKITVKADETKERVSETFGVVKEFAAREVDRIVDKTIDGITNFIKSRA